MVQNVEKSGKYNPVISHFWKKRENRDIFTQNRVFHKEEFSTARANPVQTQVLWEYVVVGYAGKTFTKVFPAPLSKPFKVFMEVVF